MSILKNNDILAEILRHLSRDDYKNAAQVAKAWNFIIKKLIRADFLTWMPEALLPEKLNYSLYPILNRLILLPKINYTCEIYVGGNTVYLDWSLNFTGIEIHISQILPLEQLVTKYGELTNQFYSNVSLCEYCNSSQHKYVHYYEYAQENKKINLPFKFDTVDSVTISEAHINYYTIVRSKNSLLKLFAQRSFTDMQKNILLYIFNA